MKKMHVKISLGVLLLFLLSWIRPSAVLAETASAPADLSEYTVELAEDACVYDGTEKQPSVRVYYEETVLEKDRDYQVSYSNNVNAGDRAQVIIQAASGSSYTGSVTKYFVIEKAEQEIKASDKTKVRTAKNFNLGAKVTSGKESDRGNLTYKSSKKDVATISKKGVIDVKHVGKTTITITAAETANYKETKKEITVTVNPTGTSIRNMRNIMKRSITVWWKKGSGVSGYEIRCSLKKNMKNAKKKVCSGASTVSGTLRNLKRGKIYYVQVRAYKTVNKDTYYSSWSKKEKLKIYR